MKVIEQNKKIRKTVDNMLEEARIEEEHKITSSQFS